MRKRITFLLLSLIVFLWFVSTRAWAAPNEGNLNPWVSPGQRTPPRYSSEAANMGKAILNPRHPGATSPGLLRSQDQITPDGISALKRHTYMGKIAAILTTNRAFTLTTNQGLKTVQTNPQTRFIKGEMKMGARTNFENLKVNDKVAAAGEVNTAGLMTAKLVTVIPTPVKIDKRHAVYGVVEQKMAVGSATVLTLRHDNTRRSFEVVVNEKTKITGKDLSRPTVDDIQVGNRVASVGIIDEQGKITAKHLHIIPGQGRGLSNTERMAPRSLTPSQEHPARINQATPQGGNMIPSP